MCLKDLCSNKKCDSSQEIHIWRFENSWKRLMSYLLHSQQAAMNCQVKHDLAWELVTVLKTYFFPQMKTSRGVHICLHWFSTLLIMDRYGVADRLAAKRLKTFAMNMFAYQSVRILAWLSGRLWLFWREANQNWPSDFFKSAAHGQRVGYHGTL